MNLSERGKRIWWGSLVAGATCLLIFRIKDLIAGNAGQVDVYLLLIWIGLILIPLFSEVDLLGIKLKKEIGSKESAVKQHIPKNHIQSIIAQYLKEPDLLRGQRYFFAAVLLVGLSLLLMNNYKLGAPLVLVSIVFGELFYRSKADEVKEINKSEIIAYLKANNLHSQEKLKTLADQFSARIQSYTNENKATLILAALLVPYYVKIINLLYPDLEKIIARLPSITAFILVLLVIILNASFLLKKIFWFLPDKQEIYKELSWFLAKEDKID